MYTPNTTKERLSTEQLEETMDWTVSNLKPVSGRDFFILEQDEKSFYEKYAEQVADPVSKSYFTEKVLTELKIHHQTGAPHCPYCTGSAKEKKKGSDEGLKIHQTQARVQKKVFAMQKQLLEKDDSFIMVIQDFSKLDYDNKNCQDLIFTVYYHSEEDEENPVAHHFYHYLSESSNDVNFVVEVWNDFLPKILEEFHVSTVRLWSDGGSKHFKNAKHLVWWWNQVKEHNFNLEYHFFEAYHGYSACDAAASHSKKQMVLVQKRERKLISQIEKASEVISSIKNHEAQVIQIDDTHVDKISNKKLTGN